MMMWNTSRNLGREGHPAKWFGADERVEDPEVATIAFSEFLQTESTHSRGFFLKKKPPFTTVKKSTCIPKML